MTLDIMAIPKTGKMADSVTGYGDGGHADDAMESWMLRRRNLSREGSLMLALGAGALVALVAKLRNRRNGGQILRPVDRKIGLAAWSPSSHVLPNAADDGSGASSINNLDDETISLTS